MGMQLICCVQATNDMCYLQKGNESVVKVGVGGGGGCQSNEMKWIGRTRNSLGMCAEGK